MRGISGINDTVNLLIQCMDVTNVLSSFFLFLHVYQIKMGIFKHLSLKKS